MKKTLLLTTLLLALALVPGAGAQGPNATHYVCKGQEYTTKYAYSFGHSERPVRIGVIVAGPIDTEGNPQYDVIDIPPGWSSSTGTYKEATLFWDVPGDAQIPFTVTYTLTITGTNLLSRQVTIAGTYEWYQGEATSAAWSETWIYGNCTYLPAVLK